VKFFVPHATSPEMAESAYSGIAKFNNAPVTAERISGLSWTHNGKEMSCEVGGPLPSYYRTGDEIVLAILDCGSFFKVCTQSRGGLRGEPVLAGKDDPGQATYFDPQGE
jgi:hypothetical protein